MKTIYEKALELRKLNSGKTQQKVEFQGFELIAVYPNLDGDSGAYSGEVKVKIMKKDIGFTFTILKEDPEDLARMQFVYNVTIACKNNQLLLPLAKKVKPDWQKIEKKFPGKVSSSEYRELNIHDKDAVVKLINKILS